MQISGYLLFMWYYVTDVRLFWSVLLQHYFRATEKRGKCSCHDDCNLLTLFMSNCPHGSMSYTPLPITTEFPCSKLSISHRLTGSNVLFYITCNRFVVCWLEDVYLKPYRAAEGKYLTPILRKSIISKVIPNYTCCTLSHPLGKRVTVRLSAFLWFLPQMIKHLSS